ncbi:MAG: ABC transporter permease [Gammaproteobacteria bacterium]|nr:ABC transporter permease [Gammaproteobacteria bacterium]MCB1881299.1 ABC transporter permease [Gammaproteobacteria bacterium]MCB1904340.1 ABC transporter permease [Gammaproteobacteria bacterium]
MPSKTPRFFGIHASPTRHWRWVLALIPFLLAIGVYLVASDMRHQENPNDKLLPFFSQMGDALHRMALVEDRRTGQYTLLQDSKMSLTRLLTGVALAASVGLLLGLNMGLFPGMSASLLPFVTFIAMIPPLAILPILFISFGVDELAKVMLIFLGTFPVITRDIYLSVKKIPREQITKSLTLGASQLALAYRIVLPQVLPRLIEAIRLSLGAAWLFLIAAEAIASTDGLGYRIFLVRRYLAMDVILPYVLWITVLGFTMDWLLRMLLRWKFSWYLVGKQ